MADQPIRLLIVDDIQSTRENLRKLLSFEEDIQVVGTAGDGKEGVEEADRALRGVKLTHPETGRESVSALRQRRPPGRS